MENDFSEDMNNAKLVGLNRVILFHSSQLLAAWSLFPLLVSSNAHLTPQ